MTTAQQIIDLTRYIVPETNQILYTDEALLLHLNYALKHLKRVRADIFIGSLDTDQADLAIGDTIPTPPEFDRALTEYIAAQASMRNDMPASAALFELSRSVL
jgi:hypothetical protein